MSAIEIQPFAPADEQGVIDVILPIQREEFGIPISIEDQPDLKAIPEFYQAGVGEFLTASVDGRVIGTIGMKDIGSGRVALRKMFVSSEYRGRQFGVSQSLLEKLLEIARVRGIKEILLGTTDSFIAAHRFYEKNGFRQIDANSLPSSFPRMAVDTRFYQLQLA